MGAKRKSGKFGDLLRGALRELGMRVQTGTDRGAADGEVVKAVERLLQALDVTLQQAGPAAELLAEGERHSVLQVGATDFYYVLEFLRLGRDRVVNALDGGNQRGPHPIRSGDVHCSRERVIGGLRHIDIIVGMDRLLRSQCATRQFDGAVGDYLVDVHVGLRTAAGLPDAQGELVVELAGDDLVGSLNDELGLVIITDSGKLAQILVHQRTGLFEDAKSADQFRRHGVAANVEVQERALRLCAPVDVRRDIDLSYAVGFDPSLWFRR